MRIVIYTPWQKFINCSICGKKVPVNAANAVYLDDDSTYVCNECNSTFRGGPLDGMKVKDIIQDYTRLRYGK